MIEIDQTIGAADEAASQFPCLYVVIFLVIIAVAYFILHEYWSRFYKGRVVAHRCRYCGKIVPVKSKCCKAKVEEGFNKITCMRCGKDTVPICSICHKPIESR